MQEVPVETTLYSLSAGAPQPGERRDGERHLTLFRVGALMVEGRRELCLIKNISGGGMLLRAYCPIPTGARLSIELKCGEPVSGTARWVEGDNVGVEFDRPVDVVDLLTHSMAGPRPRMPRVEVESLAWARQGAEIHRVHARDVSQGGIKIVTPSELALGAEVVITLPGIEPQPGVVRWREGNVYGVNFNRVLPLSTLVSWIHQQRDRLRAAS